jgi:hypothetical protein
MTSVRQAGLLYRQAIPPAATSWQATPAGGEALGFSTGNGQGDTAGHHSGLPLYPLGGQIRLTAAAPRPAASIPGLATRSYLSVASLRVGSTVQTQVNGVPVAVRIVAAVREFPTVTGGSGALIVDLPGLQQLLVSRSGTPVPVNQWWLATARHQVPAALAARLPGGSSVISQPQLAAALTGDPLTAAPQQALLATAAAAALLALTGSCVSIAAGVRQRRSEAAVLAALGVSPRSAAGQLGLEKLLLSLPAAILGLLLGTVIARLIVPAVTLTPVATQPVPPAITVLDLAQTVPLALVVGALPALAAMITILRRPDPAAQLRAAGSV